jgi:hypothetical protein
MATAWYQDDNAVEIDRLSTQLDHAAETISALERRIADMEHQDTRYNGWTNYATWRINLEICDDIVSSMIGAQTFDDVESLADYLKESVDEVLTGYGETTEGLALDYARAFVSDVNFQEIAEHTADDLVRTDTEEAGDDDDA